MLWIDSISGKNWDLKKTEENWLKVDNNNWDKVENKTTYDTIQILPRFYPDFIYILSWHHLDEIRMKLIWMLDKGHERNSNVFYPDKIR